MKEVIRARIDGKIKEEAAAALMLLAIAHTGDVRVTDQPHEMMRIANAYALAGLPRLITVLEERRGDMALDYLSDVVVEMMNH